MEIEIRVVAAVIEDFGGLVLVAKRPSHKRHGGHWEFPGGKVRDGESDFAAVARELHEELDLETLDVGRPIWESRDPGSPFRIVFLPVTVNGHPRPLEHEALHWGSPDELICLSLAPTDRRFVEEHLLGDRR